MAEKIKVKEYEIVVGLLYSKDHVWAKREDSTVRIGVTDYAQKELKEVTGVELLVEKGEEVEKGDSIATLESVKAVADVFTPVTGRVVEVNTKLEEEPTLINDDPYGEGWIAVIEISDPSELDELMKAEEYAKEVSK